MRRSIILFLIFVVCTSLTIYKRLKKLPDEKNTAYNKNIFIEQDSLIEWSENRKLTWSDFKGKPDTITFRGFGAVSYTWITFENFKVYDDSVVMDLPCNFFVYESWVVVPASSLLNHEQGHFDITEVIARKMRRDISNYISTDDDSSTKFYESVTVKYYDTEKKILNELYDKETNFSRNTEGQKRWNVKIDSMLIKLEAYSSPHVVVIRKHVEKNQTINIQTKEQQPNENRDSIAKPKQKGFPEKMIFGKPR